MKKRKKESLLRNNYPRHVVLADCDHRRRRKLCCKCYCSPLSVITMRNTEN